MAGIARIKATVDKGSLAIVFEKLKQLDKKAAKKGIRDGINEITKIVTKDVKNRVPRRTGLLKKSIGRKVIATKDGQRIVGIVGPRSGFRTQINGVWVNPVKYAHLVEYGRKEVVAGKAKGKATGKKILVGDGRPMAGNAAKGMGPWPRVIYGKRVRAVGPRSFMRNAWDAIAPRAPAIMAAAMEKAFRQYLERARTGKKAKR